MTPSPHAGPQGFIRIVSMRRTPLHRMVALLVLTGLAGCADMATIVPGTPLSDIDQKYGKPTYTCTRPDGQHRVIWSQQPSGSYAWGADIGADGRSRQVESVLTDEHFQRLSQGDWTADAVRCEFGPPAQIRQAGLGEARQVVWSYRYMRDIRWHSVMYVYMGRDGARVTRFHSAPDDRYQRSE